MPRKPMTPAEVAMKGRASRAKTTVSAAPAAGDVPKPPAWLPAPGKAEWRRLAPTLHAMGRLHPLFVGPFCSYCSAFADMVTAAKALRRAGTMTTTTTAGNVIQAAEVGALRRARADVARLGAAFGLNPKAQHGMVDTRPPAAAPTPSPAAKRAKAKADDPHGTAHFFAPLPDRLQ